MRLADLSLRKGEYGGGFSAVDHFDGAPRYIRITDITDNGDLTADVKAPSGKPDEWAQYELAHGDLLFARSGATVGKSLLFDQAMGPSVYAGYLIRFRIDPKIADPKYIHYYTKTPAYWQWVLSKQRVVAQPNINAQQYGYELDIPLPPLPTQRRIAAILDKAQALVANDKRTLAVYDQLAKSLFLQMFGDPVKNERGWEMKTLGDCAEFTGGGTPSRSNSEFYNGEICWATSKDIKTDYLLETQEHITEEAIQACSTKLVPTGTLLLVVKSKILMHHLPLAIVTKDMCFNQDLKAILPDKTLDSVFLFHQLRIQAPSILRMARGVNTEGFTLEHLRSIKLLIPKPSEQKRFVSAIKKVDYQKAMVTDSLRRSEDLFGSLLQGAFNGSLGG